MIWFIKIWHQNVAKCQTAKSEYDYSYLFHVTSFQYNYWGVSDKLKNVITYFKVGTMRATENTPIMIFEINSQISCLSCINGKSRVHQFMMEGLTKYIMVAKCTLISRLCITV